MGNAEAQIGSMLSSTTLRDLSISEMQEFKYKMPILRARGVGNACGTLFREAISTDTEKFERKLKSKPAVAEWTML